MKILITGGAGFVGSHLAKSFRLEFPKAKITVFDNLHRKGSELNVPLLQKLGIDFVKGDVRYRQELFSLNNNFDLLVEASAEPSVHAGNDGAPDYLLDTNILGAVNCLEFARKHVKKFLFLSTSRVYSLSALKEIPLAVEGNHFSIQSSKNLPLGCSKNGIAENFPVNTSRSLYGASKLAAELLIQEYVDTFQMECLINRCGVIAGAGQFGKTDQGVFTLWLANHYFQKPLKFTGFGGMGMQVRDLLHPADLYSLIRKQLDKPEKWNAGIYNIGGGQSGAVSLKEWTLFAQNATGKTLAISSDPIEARVDIPYYVSDSSKAEKEFAWRPLMAPQAIAEDIYQWLKAEEKVLQPIFG